MEGTCNQKDGLNIRVGRWNVPGNPIAILVDFTPFYKDKMIFIRKHGLTFM